jgi:CHASE2 domain-containing sensor protein
LIKKINRYQPKVIGLDVFRDTPQPNAAGYQQLLATLQTVPNLVVACQTGEDDQAGQQAVPSIAAPKLPPTTTAIGYADSLLPDGDTVIRRYVVQMDARPGSACIAEQSFAWQIVQQIVPELKLNSVVPADFGGYQDDPAQFGDDQLVVNYHASSRNIQPYSLQDILYLNTDSELKQLFQDSVVLIGYNLGGKEDTHATPIGRQNGVMIHTHVIRQLLGQTPSLRSLPQWAESGGILLGSLLGGGLFWCGRSWRNRLALTLLLLLGMTLLAYLAMLQAVWLSLLPIAMASLITIIAITIIEQQVRSRAHRPTT